ncbi:bifunctional DNA-formamidopyrimidine glycosylase/DNA-(apurinic or apyrimidinic site) lyase [Flocculibacter collagenilyticus]|uniref:bifunctional DNA-formamidopyrimidine glycosylase/DNA-(apurinic or apyrimidinic site) lyase n=1 Tax=Flocculibacter collagenilyticus TaxID=2744479 RepID=UPI0018F44C6E|nr:bifunctional DNA-formamidopyrimidine glycosylase/DNA-(apurinic or apyrimidinic site) lyase [Flocculibacter collagenilyticus]
MPELPEVEVSRQGIQPHIEQKTITNIIIRQPQLRWPIPQDVHLAKNEKVVSVTRRAKYLLLNTEKGSIILHLGMSGKLRVVPSTTPVQKHDHVDIEFDNHLVLRLNDPRRFGAMLWQGAGEPTHSVMSKLGPEPLTDIFTAEYIYDKSRGRSGAIKQFIMDNAIVVGVGNIYANESLFKAGIHPKRAAGKVSLARYQRLVPIIKQTLQTAIQQGGTTLKDFTQVDGKPGYFAQQLDVYGRGGEKCHQCGETLKEIRLGQRSTVYCGQCQT